MIWDVDVFDVSVMCSGSFRNTLRWIGQAAVVPILGRVNNSKSRPQFFFSAFSDVTELANKIDRNNRIIDNPLKYEFFFGQKICTRYVVDSL